MSLDIQIPATLSPPERATDVRLRAPAAETPAITGAAPEITLIEPAHRWKLLGLRELWAYRELLYFLIWRDIKVRYKQTVLGAAWAVLQPAMMMIVFTIFFGRLARVDSGDWAYPVYVYAGLLPWTFFAAAITNAGNSVIGSERLISKIYFPRLLVPLAAVGAGLVDFAVAAVGLPLLMWYFAVPPSVELLLVPVFMILLTLAALGVGTLLAALNVAYRDFRHVIPFLVQLWMFATPSIYMEAARAGHPRDAVASAGAYQGSGFFEWFTTLAHYVLAANPLTGLISAFRAAAFGAPIPWSSLAMSSVLVVLVAITGCLYFRRVEDSFADIV